MTNPLHYPSLENCKRLTEMWFPYTEQYWSSNLLEVYKISEWFWFSYDWEYVCPSIAELLDEMPKRITVDKKFFYLEIRGDMVVYCWFTGQDANFTKVTIYPLPNALAETWIWLKENNYIK